MLLVLSCPLCQEYQKVVGTSSRNSPSCLGNIRSDGNKSSKALTDPALATAAGHGILLQQNPQSSAQKCNKGKEQGPSVAGRGEL